MYFADHHVQLYDLLKSLRASMGKEAKGLEYFKHFEIRLVANYHSLISLLDKLYDGNQDINAIVSRLVINLHNQYQLRSDELKELDLKRERDNDWLLSEKWVGMMLYVDHFSNDLAGFSKRIPYLEELGINWIHLMPLLKSPEGENDGGYAVSDYRTVEPRLGTMDDIARITKKFRKKGMLMAIDYVMNHTSDEHEWAMKAKAGDPLYQDYFFMFDDRQVPDQFELTMPEVFPDSAPGNFTFNKESQKWVMTQFHNYQWDLNYYNPTVLLEMIDTAFFLANQGVDILRLDAVPFIWKKLGTACRNEEEAHIILRIFKACFEIVAPGVAFIAEAIVRPHEIMSYFGQNEYRGKECDIAYNATFMALCWEALATGNVNVMRYVMSKMQTKPIGTTWINYLRSHDDIGLGFDDEDLNALGIDARGHRKFILDYYTGEYPDSLATGVPFAYNPKTGDARISGTLSALSGLEKAIELNNPELIDLSIQRIMMLQSVILSYGGLPMIYSGGEIGLSNDYGYQNDKKKAHDNRWIHRPKMDWKKAEKREKPGSVENRVFEGLKKLIEIRKNTPEFADRNTFSLEDCENTHIFCFLRWGEEGRTLVMANFFRDTQFVKWDILSRIGLMRGNILDSITDEPPRYHHDLIEFKPYQCYWIREKF